MKKVVVLGLGNILMGDDGVGVYVLNDLAKDHPIPNVDYIAGETDVSYALEMTRHANLLLIIDAVASGGNPGEIYLFPYKENHPLQKGFSMHNLHFLEEAGRLGMSWNGIIIGIEAESIEFHLGLSPTLQACYPAIIQKVSRIMQDICTGGNHPNE